MIQRIAEALIVIGLAVPCAAASADVKAQEKSHVRFEGGLGRMMGIFGGKAMKDGLVSTSAVKGDRKLTMNDATGQIVDLGEEKVYDLDLRNRTYTVTTFAEMRKRMEEARQKAAEQQSRSGEGPAAEKNEGKEIEIDFDLKETGQKRVINGFDAREVVMTVIAREKGKTLEESGGMVMTNTSWLTPDLPALKEVSDFDRRYAEKLYGPAMIDAQQMAMAVAMYPMLKDAMARMQKERVDLDGAPVLTVMKVEAAASPEQAAAAAKEKEEPPPAASAGGLGGMLARKMMRRKENEKKDAAAPATPGRATVFTMQHEVLKVTPAATDADVALPEGFKEKR